MLAEFSLIHCFVKQSSVMSLKTRQKPESPTFPGTTNQQTAVKTKNNLQISWNKKLDILGYNFKSSRKVTVKILKTSRKTGEAL